MADNQTVLVRKLRADGLIEWRPSSPGARLAELLELLRDDPQLAYGDHVELVNEATGCPVDPESSVESLGGRGLAIRDRFVAYALHQLWVLQIQLPAVSSFELMPGSTVIRLELECPGLLEQKTTGRRHIYLRGRHRMLIIIPQSFPDSAPRLVWLTPIFHPNLAADTEVWPPGLNWAESRNLVTLVGALMDTLRGQLVATRPPWNLTGEKPLNANASSFFRRHRRSIADFARSAGPGPTESATGMPLTSPGTAWRLDGTLSGGRPMIFLSQRFHHGFLPFVDYGPGWLVGQRGKWCGSNWFYVDQIVPSYKGAVQPIGAIGVTQGGTSGWESMLNAEVRDGRPIFRPSRDSDEVDVYFVRHDGPLPVDSEQSAYAAPKQRIIVASKGTRWTRTEESGIIEASTVVEDIDVSEVEKGRLVHKKLDPPLCIYCGSTCTADQDWGVCRDCDTVSHTGCTDRLGGCPYTGCRRCPLYLP